MNIQNLEENNGTSNCYIIQKPGIYSFPLVYGNGNIDEKCFDYKGQKIENKEIEGAKFVDLVSWDSSREFIKELELKNNRIITTISYVPNTGANYIIAVRDITGTIIWSWHLWLWKDELVVDNETKLLNVDLASVWIKGKLRSWYYQWGRKDPIYPGERNKPRMYRINNNKNSISHPLGYVEKKSYNTTTQFGDWDPEKTIYDPCPPGYKVPDPETLKKLETGKNYFVKKESAKLGELYFYLNGFRGIGTRDLKTGKYLTGLISGLGITGRYWANNLGYVMNIECAVGCVSIKYNSWTSRLNAMSVRPQKI